MASLHYLQISLQKKTMVHSRVDTPLEFQDQLGFR